MKKNLWVIVLAVGGCGGSVVVAPNNVACETSSPEAGADTKLCPVPARTVLVTECSAPAPDPYPVEKYPALGCVEYPVQAGRVWCCVPATKATGREE